MNFSQKLGIFCLILITVVYVYFSFFSDKDIFPKKSDSQFVENEITDDSEIDEAEAQGKEIKIVKIFVTDSKGNLRSVNRKCNVSEQKSCFEFAVRELITAPTRWEKSKGLSSEIPADTKVLSIRESSDNILIDLSSNFEGGGGAESIYTRIYQLIKTARANTKLPVYLYINGKQAEVIGGEGIMIKQPLNEGSLND